MNKKYDGSYAENEELVDDEDDCDDSHIEEDKINENEKDSPDCI